MRRPQHNLLLDTLLLGVVGALSAQLFVFLLKHCQTLFLVWLAGYRSALSSDPGALALGHGPWLLPLATTLGGLLAGVIVYTFAPEAEGHGTDTVVHAFHNLNGIIRARVPLVKLVASAITIGSGGSAGREGPTALISAGIASAYAVKRRRSEEEVRLLTLVGMAAGLSAIFRSPIGTAIFAIEVLYGEMEFEADALVFTMLGSVVAYAVNGFFVGFRPLFNVPATLAAPGAANYLWYVVLGAACGVVATILPMVFYSIRDLFRTIPCPPHFKPAIGGLAVGLIAVLLPQLLGGGYSWIQAAIDGRLAGSLLLLLCFGKILTFALTIGSGGSGGVFAPSLYTGAMIGGFLSQLCHQPAAAFVVVGMAAVFGAAARVPIATLLMVTEMTGGYHLLVPAALAVMLSYMVQNLLSARLKYESLYEAQVPTRPYSPSHYIEQLRIALDLLNTHGISNAPKGRGLELVSLLASGVPVTLPDHEQVRIGVLRPRSSWAGQAAPAITGVEFILVLRHNRVLFPHPELKLEAGDQLIAVAGQAAWNGLRGHLDSVARVGRNQHRL
ncbi:MAG TPA: chloride channel protein [Bryobacteraceae bacterium]|nr:chloride channel protein [Bryobacteraceae bacterium]